MASGIQTANIAAYEPCEMATPPPASDVGSTYSETDYPSFFNTSSLIPTSALPLSPVAAGPSHASPIPSTSAEQYPASRKRSVDGNDDGGAKKPRPSKLCSTSIYLVTFIKYLFNLSIEVLKGVLL